VKVGFWMRLENKINGGCIMKYLKQGFTAFYRIVFFRFTGWGRNGCNKREDMTDFYWAGKEGKLQKDNQKSKETKK
jgi:hypothetical protein